jgi:hypothetical protein
VSLLLLLLLHLLILALGLAVAAALLLVESWEAVSQQLPLWAIHGLQHCRLRGSRTFLGREGVAGVSIGTSVRISRRILRLILREGMELPSPTDDRRLEARMAERQSKKTVVLCCVRLVLSL